MRTRGPDVIVFQHDHTRKIVSVRVNPAHDHPILLYQSEPRCSLARPSDDTLIPVPTRLVQDSFRPEFTFRKVSNAVLTEEETARERAYLVAIPEHRASMFKATRSPRRICLAFPRTVATCLTGSNVSPSRMCHSTLRPEDQSVTTRKRNPGKQATMQHSLTPQLCEHLLEERPPRQDRRRLALPQQPRFADGLAHDEPAVVERRGVFGEPGLHLGLPARWEEVREVVVSGRCACQAHREASR